MKIILAVDSLFQIPVKQKESAFKFADEIEKELVDFDRHCRFDFDAVARIAGNREANISSAFQGGRRVRQIVALVGIAFEAGGNAVEFSAG